MSMKLKTMLKYVTLGFAIIPALIIAIVGFFAVSGFSSEIMNTDARAMGTAQSASIEACINEYINDLIAVTENPKIIGALELQNTPNANFIESMTNDFKTRTAKGDDILDMLFISTNGTIYCSTNEADKGATFYGFENISNLPLSTNYISPISISNTNYNDNVFFVARGIVNDSGDKYGYIVEVVSTSRITSILKNTTYFSSGYVMLSDGANAVLNYNSTDISRIEEVSGSDLKNIMTIEKKEVKKSEDYSAGGFVGNYCFLNSTTGSSWRWISAYPASNAFGSVFMPIVISTSVLLILALACVALGALETNSVVKPLTNMISIMHDIKSGDSETRFNVKGKGEFAEMAQTFNNMLDEVSLSEELHRTISDISDNMLFEWDFHKEIMYISENFKETFDINPQQSALSNGKFLDSLMTEEFSDQYKKDINTLLKNKTGYNGEYIVRCKNGASTWVSVRAMCVTDRLGELLRVIGVVTDIDSEKKLELQLSERASYDFLSQLYNRSTFERELKSELERSKNSKVGILFVDIDDFKFINDRYGHSVGDEVIKFVSDRLKTRIQGSGFAGRFGGDEFVLCITTQKQIEDIENLALDLIDELYNGYFSDLANANLNVKASIGISISPEHGDEGNRLVAAADEAMYFVKKNGKANYHIYQPEDAVSEDLKHTM